MRIQCKGNKGFSLVELIVVMAIFVIVVGISGYAFNTLLIQGGMQGRSSAANAEALVGLDLLRKDLSHAGFGLLWSYPTTPPTISEPPNNPAVTGAPSLSEPSSAPPHAVVSSECSVEVGGAAVASTNHPGPNYLAIRSALADPAADTKRWSYSIYTSAAGKQLIRTWGGGGDLQPGDQVVVLNATFSKDLGPDKRLVTRADTGAFSTSVSGTPLKFSDTNFAPQTILDNYLIYKIGANPSRPFSRTDYYLRGYGTGTTPDRCAPNTGFLAKGVVASAGNGYTEYPLLDCVADMQILYNLGGGSYATAVSTWSAADLRKNLQEVQVYILTHEGGKDRNYSFPSTSIVVGRGTGSGRSFDLSGIIGSDYKYYRWKVYLLSVKMENLN